MATPDVTALAVSAGPGGAAVLWSHTLSSAGEYWFRRVGSDGTPLAAGIRIDRITRTAAAGGVDIASNGTEWAAVWVDGTNGRFQRLAADGSPAMAMPRDISTVCRSRPRLAFSATLGWVLFCRDASGSGQLQVLGTDGMGTALPVRVGTSTVEPRGLAIAADGSMMAVYLVSSSSLSAQLINPDTSITAPSVTIGTSRESGGVVWDGQTFVVAIRQFVSSTTYEIRTLRGATLTSNTLVRTVTGLPSVPVPAVAPDRSSIVLTWASGSAAPMDLWSARLAVPAAPTGAATILAPAANLLTTTTVDDVPGPGVVFIDANQVVFGWADTRWGQTEPYAVGASLGGCS